MKAPAQAEAFIAQLPIEAFFGIGPRTAVRMHGLGIHSGAELRKQPLELLTEHFSKQGAHYYQVARGADERLVEPNRPRKSLGAETTFEQDTKDVERLVDALLPLCETVTKRLAQAAQGGQVGLEGRVVVLKLKYNSRS